jgi:branched-chain amino acid transport system substrate-binding protein
MRLIKLSFQTSIFFVFLAFFLPAISIAQDPEENLKIVKIGLLIPDNKSLASRNGAELAIHRANERGAVNGLPIRLVVRSMEGPWGTGSKEAVSMIFDENVIAIMGSHDDRKAHLVEQVTTKSRVVFLSSWASDPTLSQAFVPWFFNCVPNDLQQAESLIEEIYNKRRLNKITVVSDESYDSQSALRNFLKKVAMDGKPVPIQFSMDSNAKNINDLTEKILTADPGCVVIFLQPPVSLKIIEQLNLIHLNRPVFGSLALLDENRISGNELKDYENAIIVSSFNLPGRKGMLFSEEYKKTYGTLPGAAAAYAYDGMNLLIEAIRKAGQEYEKIQKYMAEIKYEGVTGIIQFDNKGNRRGIPGFVEIKNGSPVPVK